MPNTSADSVGRALAPRVICRLGYVERATGFALAAWWALHLAQSQQPAQTTLYTSLKIAPER